MKLATFRIDQGAPALGVVDTDKGMVIDCRKAFRQRFGRDEGALHDMLSLMDAGGRGMDLVHRVTGGTDTSEDCSHPLDSVYLLAPVPVPRQARDFSVFERHIRDAPKGGTRLRARLAGLSEDEMVAATPPPAGVYFEQPPFYFTNRFNFVGSEEIVRWPQDSRHLDFELEIGMFVGTTGTNIRPESARSHVFGYTIFNDVSARDVQVREMTARLGPAKGKSFDTANVIGPWIVTPDEMPDPASLEVTVRVNGVEWIRTTTADMLHSFEDMIVFASRGETLHAGEFFGSGCVGGCSGLELDRWVADGDVVELEVLGIGVLRNRFRSGEPAANNAPAG